jgi:hypothetical protein
MELPPSCAFPPHPLACAGQISESLQAELDIILATTNAEEELSHRKAEVTVAGTSAAFKQMQYYRRQRKEILQNLIQEKREYIELLKQKIAEYDDDRSVAD